MTGFDSKRQAAQAKLEQKAEPPPEWLLIKNILDEYGLDAIAFVAEWKAAQQQAEPVLLECVTCGTVYADGVPPQVPVQERITHITWDERGVRTVNGIPDDSPQRQWVGLTDEEILRADPRFGKSESDVNPYQILGSARDLEAKLKERNT